MTFDYKNFITGDFYRPNYFGATRVVSPQEFTKLQHEYEEDHQSVMMALGKLRERTSSEYFRKIYRVQSKAMTYSKKVFPTYKFIMPDALADDWLSTVDWHKKYPTRDHSLHQTLTAYIVARLLGNGNPKASLKLPNKKNLLNLCAENMVKEKGMSYFRNYTKSLGIDVDGLGKGVKERWAKDVFYEAAIIAALFHDMGYPWQYVNRLGKSIEMAEYVDSTSIVTSVKATMESIRNRLLIYPFYGYSETNMKHAPLSLEKEVLDQMMYGLRNTHGFPGALGFMCLNDKIRCFHQIPSLNEISYRLILDWAAVAIMMHDMKGLYWDNKKKNVKNPFLRLSFSVDPLSSLISLADVLEEFNRPSAGFTPKNHSVSIRYRYACEKTKVEIINKELHIYYFYNTLLEVNENRSRREDEVYEYFNSANGFVDLSPLGITDVHCHVEKK